MDFKINAVMVQLLRSKNICLYLLLGIIPFAFVSCKSVQEKIVKDENGVLKEKYMLDSKTGLKEGRYIVYNDNNQKSEEGFYKKGQLEGKRVLYRYEDESVEIIENYKDNKLEGEYKIFYPSAHLKQKGYYKNNVTVGVWESYYENGQIKEKVTMSNNTENGPFVEYYENGNIKAEGQYLDGDNEDGLLKMYNKKGELVRKMDCVKRKCHTIWKAEGEE